MHARPLLAIAFVGALLLPRPGVAQNDTKKAPDRRPGIAVFPFTNGGSFGASKEDLSPLEVGIQQMVLTELSQNSNLRIVDRSALKQILEEQNLVGAGRVDASTAARLAARPPQVSARA